MKYNQRLKLVKHYVVENFVDVEDVTTWLGLTIEDVMDAFPDALESKYEEIKDEVETFEEDIGSGNNGDDEETGGY